MALPEYDPSIFCQDLPELSFFFLDSGNVARQETECLILWNNCKIKESPRVSQKFKIQIHLCRDKMKCWMSLLQKRLQLRLFFKQLENVQKCPKKLINKIQI